jgi:hypothetical protein
MAKVAKLDLYKKHKAEYAASRKPMLVTIGPASYLSIIGQGKPGGPEFTARVGALYNVAFTIKMAKKFAGFDYAVCKLEGLWWETKGKGGSGQAEWSWKLLIRVPEAIEATDRAAALATLAKKNKGPLVNEVRLETITEGLCVQALHVGPYAQEPETIARMKAHAEENGLAFHGQHHEIYLSDPRRVAPEKLRTILRQPVK